MRSRDFPAYFPDGTRFYASGADVFLTLPGSGWFRVALGGLVPAAESPDSPPPLAVLETGREITEEEFPAFPVLWELHNASLLKRDRRDMEAAERETRAMVAEQDQEIAAGIESDYDRGYRVGARIAEERIRAAERAKAHRPGSQDWAQLSCLALFLSSYRWWASGLHGAGRALDLKRMHSPADYLAFPFALLVMAILCTPFLIYYSWTVEQFDNAEGPRWVWAVRAFFIALPFFVSWIIANGGPH